MDRVSSIAECLYRRLLGDEFETLPEALRRFHDRAEGGSASGLLRVSHGKGWLHGRITRLLRLPRPGDHVTLRLRVMVENEGERWIRDFDTVRLETRQWIREGLLIETVGPLRVGYRVTSGREALTFESVRGWFYALPLPRALMPRIEALVTGSRPDAWFVHVRVEAPVLGLLVSYEGEVTPT